MFFNYMFPLIFFFVFAQAMHGDRGNAMTQIVTMVIIIGVLGNGLFGAGMRAVQEREVNILRRYKVTPITPAPILIAATIVGWIIFMPLRAVHVLRGALRVRHAVADEDGVHSPVCRRWAFWPFAPSE